MGFLQETFLQNALAAALISGALCAYLGVYVHLKRIIFIGIALSEVAALGVAAGLFVGGWPEATASVLTVLVALLFWLPGRQGLLDREALLGLVYCVSAALAILLLAVNPMAEAHGVDLVSGNLLYTMGGELLVLSLVAGGTLTLHLILFPRFLFVSFDPETAKTLGLEERTVEFLMYLTLGLCIAVSMKTAGVLFVFSSMVIPPMAGLILCRRVWAVFVVAVLVAMAAALFGLWASFSWDLPTGPAIVCVEGFLFLLAAFARVFR